MRSLRAALRLAYTCALTLFIACAFSPPCLAKDTWVEVRSPNFIVISNSGEKEARRIADQFEQFREVFQKSLPQLRVDLGKPLTILAVKNEDSLKLLLPAFWDKGHAHPAGIFVPGEEQDFVAVRTDIGGDMPYEVVYHEYTHAIMNRNFRGLPIWLGEGLAEFFGNSVIRDKEVEIGKASEPHLLELQQNRLIPLDALLTADAHSPYYNEQNRVSVFYAESWAIVHYLMMDPTVSKQQLLTKFFAAYEASGDPVQSAQSTFGDLKKFSETMEAYARQRVFYFAKVPTSIHGDAKSYSSRELSPADLAAERAFFYAHTQRPKEALAAIDEALQGNPNLPAAYEARGFLAYTQGTLTVAQADFSRAIELGSTNYFAYYFAAKTAFRSTMPSAEERPKIVALLEKALAMNPQFAPAYATLASVYSTDPATYQKAYQAGLKSVNLEPGNLTYAINYAFVLVNTGKTDDARVLTARIQKVAKTPQDRAGVDSLAAAVESRAIYDRQMAEYKQHMAELKQQTTAITVTANPSSAPATPDNPAPSKHAGEAEFAVEGIIASVDCNATSTGKLTLTVNRAPMSFTFSSLKDVRLTDSAKDITANGPACSTWTGKHVRLYFYKTKNKPYVGEVDTIQFF